MIAQEARWHPSPCAIALPLMLSLLLAGCQRTSRSSNAYVPLVEREAAQGLQIAQRFWQAQATADSAAVRHLAATGSPQEWATRWRMAYPLFFDSTQHHIAYRHGYFLNGVRDTAIVEVEVPWVTCKPPAHEGKADRYFLKLVPLDTTWRITRVWSDPC